MNVTPSSHESILNRFVSRLSSYSVVGFSTFLIDLSLIWVFVNLVKLSEPIALGAAFLIAFHINYLVLRLWVYRKTLEKVPRTYTYFVTLAIAVTFIIPTMVVWFESLFGLEMFTSRILVATLLGMIGFSFNTFFNFRVL